MWLGNEPTTTYLKVTFNGIKRHVCFVVMETAGERDVSVVKVACDWLTAGVTWQHHFIVCVFDLSVTVG